MKHACNYDRNGWRLTSFGNGFAYLLEDTENKREVWFQGDDADYFRGHVIGEDGFLVDNCEERFADYSDVMRGG